jgi:ArsR family transcriptional regulator
MSKQARPLVQGEPCCTPLVREPLAEDWAGDLALMFKALGDPVRLRLLSRVASHAGGEACVCDLSVGFDLSQPTISHHLKVLREAGLLQCERRGTWVYYWVVPSALAQLSAVLGSTDLTPTPLSVTVPAVLV